MFNIYFKQTYKKITTVTPLTI